MQRQDVRDVASVVAALFAVATLLIVIVPVEVWHLIGALPMAAP